ncbi:hypothetical protein HBI47_110140 [Parastagonospora nodorum]|nr:hypothetical protein HBI47_110140 [Parastagonospora nodorum]
MTVSLDGLPYDILFYIASSIHLDDVVHLSQTCRQLRSLLDERTLQRCVVESFNHAKETALARTEEITYKEALHAIYDRRDAMSNAHPFSARVLGQGNSFLYRHGIICILQGQIVNVMDVRSASPTVRHDLGALVKPVLESAFTVFGSIKISLMYYSDHVLAIYVEPEARPNAGYIFALRTERHVLDSNRVLAAFHVMASSKVFVRHNARYLYYGTHTGIGDDGHHKWEVSGVSLHDKFPLPDTGRPLLFEDFHGTDIGSTIAFEIYNNHFYAVSNQGTFEVEEVDWTSFYHCIRFPLDKPVMKEMLKDERVYRRQHAQGPIHDSWTDLTLQLGECTNEVMILESRREWAQASSRQSRTFYTSKFHVKPKHTSKESSSAEEDTDTVLLPENDLFVDLLDSSNKPNWMPTPPQYSWSRHPEFTKTETSPRSFILAKTKFRAYNHSCTSFLDLVEDEYCCNDPTKPGCLRLRVGSRHSTSLNISPLHVKGKSHADDTAPMFNDHVFYRNSSIHMWPPPASRCPCSKRLHDIMNPPLQLGPSNARSVTGVLDDRTLVYMVTAGRSYGASDDSALGTIVVVDFTRPYSSTPSQMRRVDNELDTDEAHWQWTTGQLRRCKSGTCL